MAEMAMHPAAARPPSPPRSIAIVGRGFTGIAVAAALLERAERPLTLYLIDRDETVGGGVAYGRPRAGEILNVRTQALSLLASTPGEFAKWLEGDESWGGYPDTEDVRQVFAPRAAFADYVRARFTQLAAARPSVRVRMLEGAASRIAAAPAGGFFLEVENCEPIDADAVVLATGYGDPEREIVFGRSPFAPFEPELVASARQVALIGSGLTMVDVWHRLRGAGYRGRIAIISRHGRLALPHTVLSPPPRPPGALRTASAAALFRDVRAHCRAALASGQSWQAAMNGIRPVTQQLWLALPPAERRRLWRHARWAWAMHRHRMPRPAHVRILADIEAGGTTLERARVLAVHDERTVWLAAADGAEAPEQRAVDLAVDCSGHRPDLRSNLVKALLREGLAMKDGLGRGLAVTAGAEMIAPTGGIVPGLFAAGPLGEGSLLEITGAPEISGQAAVIAARILAPAASGGQAGG